MDAYNPVATPLEAGAKLSKKQSPSLEKEESEMANIPYRRAVGSLMYCMVGTRPNIATAVGVVARYLNNPRLAHWQVVKKLLRYLQGL
jgi:ATP-binding cassette subfamily B (MDR/TAP) protein 1